MISFLFLAHIHPDIPFNLFDWRVEEPFFPCEWSSRLYKGRVNIDTFSASEQGKVLLTRSEIVHTSEAIVQ